MADDTQAEKPVEEPKEEQQDEPMPSSEEAETPEAGEEADLPEGVSERTKEQFNKLKETNRQLKEQIEKQRQFEPIFDSMRPRQGQSNLTQGQLDQVTVTDPNTGERYIDEKKLSDLLTQSTQRAEQAVSQVQQFMDQQQTREAFTAIPQLDPKAKDFDPELHRATRAYIMDSMMNPQDYNGRQLSYREAGEIAVKAMRADQKRAEAESNAQLEAKEQGSLEATGRSDKRQNVTTNREELRDRIRRDANDTDALMQALEGLSDTGKS